MISNSTRFIKIAIFLCAILLIQKLMQAQTMPWAIHSVTRQIAQPTNNVTFDINPPTSLWPAVKGKNIH